jgi:hypothetical protein
MGTSRVLGRPRLGFVGLLRTAALFLAVFFDITSGAPQLTGSTTLSSGPTLGSQAYMAENCPSVTDRRLTSWRSYKYLRHADPSHLTTVQPPTNFKTQRVLVALGE